MIYILSMIYQLILVKLHGVDSKLLEDSHILANISDLIICCSGHVVNSEDDATATDGSLFVMCIKL